MRDIKFRGKRVDNGQWIKGYLVKQQTDINNKYISYICPELVSFVRDGFIARFEKVDIKTIGQFTGLKDKNGKEIYEGDILIFGKHIKYKVIFEDGCFYLYHHEGLKEWDGKDYRWGPLYRVKELQFDAQVIDNIHENNQLI